MTQESVPRPEQDASLEALAQATIAANLASMQVIHDFQLGSRVLEHAVKADSTLVTSADLASEKAAKATLHARFPNVQILGEEFGSDGNEFSTFMFLVDPLDGTRPFSAGAPTSTTITAVYSKPEQRLQAVTIGEPATGRMWYSAGMNTMRFRINPMTGEPVQSHEPCQVWEGQLAPTSTVLVDNFQGFAREGGKRQILTNNDVLRLLGNLQPQTAVQNYGSNGLHHALVANGGEKVAGAITTAMGGEFDVAGALLVLGAGGVARGLRMNPDRTLTEADPLDPFEYDLLVTANNQQTLETLTDIVRASVVAE